MTGKFEKGLENVAEGAAVIFIAPSVIKEIFEGTAAGSGAGVEFLTPELEGIAEAGIDIAQGVAAPLAFVMIAYLGLKHMIKGGKDGANLKKSRLNS